MNNTTVSRFEDGFGESGCEFCEGRGYYPKPDGAWDYETVACSCKAGERREREIYQLMEDNPDLL